MAPPAPPRPPRRDCRWLEESRLDPDARADLRHGWGISNDDRVAVLLADSPHAMDAVKAIVAVGLAAETGRPWRLLLHPGATGADRAAHITHAMGRPERLIFDERVMRPWSILPACDAALVIDRPCLIAMTWAMLARAPVVAEHNETTDAWLTHDQSALLSRPDRMRKISWALCRLHDEAALGEQLSEAARAALDA